VIADVVPVVLLAQGGGHGHVLTVGVSIGPTVLRVALLASVPVVAAFALLRGFLTEPDRRAHAAVITCAGSAAVLVFMLSGGLNLSERVVPLLIALLAVPLYLALSRDPRFAPAVDRVRRFAPWVFWSSALLAAAQFTAAWFAATGPAATTTALYTGVVLALVAMAWFAVSRTRKAVATVGVRLGAAVLAMVLMAGAAQATVLRAGPPTEASQGAGER
jgi:hypothetical protein